MAVFEEEYPSLETYWRSIVLFGLNVASYKFALAKSLLKFSDEQKTFVTLAELAEPYSDHICEHLKQADKQATSRSSRFLDLCRGYNQKRIARDELIAGTVKLGFNNVIDAFHVVNKDEVPVRFFHDERSGTRDGITLTDELFTLPQSIQKANFSHEVEARWRLVETAWDLNVSRNLITVDYDVDEESFYTIGKSLRRITITSCRKSLNGYQKGKCLYCFDNISIVTGAETLADVDHFFPHILKKFKEIPKLDGVWNLVLACQKCNRGETGKFASVPALPYLERLHKRNEFLISSHHPLRETIINQTGATVQKRVAFLQSAYRRGKTKLVHNWSPVFEHPPAF